LVSIDEDYRDFVIELNISEQSPEINSKVDGEELGAGDQGLMYGYATNETKVYLPIPYALSTKLIKDYELKFASKNIGYKFDSKAQASFDYSTMKFVNINISVQHSKDKTIEEIREELYPFIIETVKEFEEQNELKDLISNETEITINNGGTFIMGGAIADAGLTGRKIIADSYGG
jgi:S-adenosylmethionine synthetase